MDYERRKQKYLDKLKTATSRGLKSTTRIPGIQNDNSLCFNETNESHRQYVEPNDLLAKVERYMKENPSSYVTKNRLTTKSSIHQHGFQSNMKNRNNLETVYKPSTVQNADNIISFIKPKQTLVNYKPNTKIKVDSLNADSSIKQQQKNLVQNEENVISLTKPKKIVVNYKPDTKIKFGPPNATSTIKQQQKNTPKQGHKPMCNKNKKYGIDENSYLVGSLSNCSSSSKFISDIPKYQSSILDQEIDKNKFFSIEEKAKLDLTYCAYLEFVHSHFDEINCKNEKVYPSNDYSIHLKNRLQQIKYRHQNAQNMDYTKLSSSSSPSIKYSDNISSKSVSSCSDFNFNPVINLPNSPTILDECASLFSQDSFVCHTQETLFTTNIVENAMNIDKINLELIGEYSSLSEICPSENNKNQHQREMAHYQSISISTCLTSIDSSLERSIQKMNDNEESSFENSEDSFKNY